MKKVITTWLGMAVAIAVAGHAAEAQSPDKPYPDKPIKFVVPFAAGSATDVLARVLADHAAKANGWSTVVENMAGANGAIAARTVARAAPDGTSVLITTNTTHGANQSMMKSVPYDAVKDFVPLTKLGTITLALVTHPSVPAKSVADLVAYTKASPGKLTFGAGSSSARMAAELMKSQAGIDIRHVAYRSNPLAMQDLIGGHISMMFADVTTTLPQVKTGTVNGLAVSSLKRTALAPDLPTMDEAGLKGYELIAWFGAFAPAGTPEPIAARLRQALVGAIGDVEGKQRLATAGIEPEISTSAELAAFVVAEIAKWAAIVKTAGIEPE